MTTINIPLATLPVGITTVGPGTIPTGAKFAEIVIDRTVAGGLNSQPVTTQILLTVFESIDGGNSFLQAATASCLGGIHVGVAGTATTNSIGVSIYPNATQAKATLNVTGSSVAVSGTLTLQ